jgi:hypothetical protein
MTDRIHNVGYGLRRAPLLLGTSVNKAPVNAPASDGWHHAWWRPAAEIRAGKEEKFLCRSPKKTRHWFVASSEPLTRETWTQ